MDAKKEAYRRFLAGEPFYRIAKETGVSRTTLQRWKKGMKPIGIEAKERQKPDFVLPELPEDGRTAEEIIEARKIEFKHKRDYYESRNLIDVKVNVDGPIAVVHFGDPHLDDPGTDLDLFTHHCNVVNATEGMFAGNVGDILNNWVGRLSALYANQSTTADEGWKLAEWMVESLPWLYILAGNHDCWSGHRDPLKWITKQVGQPYINHGTRLRLNFPNGKHTTMNVAHDFKGHSQWNDNHGLHRKGKLWPDDIFVCGHRHVCAISAMADPREQKLQWLIRVGSYKRFDDFPRQLGLEDTNLVPCVVTIIDPYSKNPVSNVLVIPDVDLAAAVLTHLRTKWKKEHGKKLRKKSTR